LLVDPTRPSPEWNLVQPLSRRRYITSDRVPNQSKVDTPTPSGTSRTALQNPSSLEIIPTPLLSANPKAATTNIVIQQSLPIFIKHQEKNSEPDASGPPSAEELVFAADEPFDTLEAAPAAYNPAVPFGAKGGASSQPTR
ncbi:hypothetical protein FRC04_007018, partial [Tulasnella sp. 424]